MKKGFFTITIELANFIVTTLAFFAAGYAIYLQKEATLKQEIIGAWQVLANKASGNSGKKEAIEFLASQGLSLRGIDMSKKTHDGPVYLDGLFNNFKEDRRKIFLVEANFSKASLISADFSKASLISADFSEANLDKTNFSGADLKGANFSGDDLVWANFSGSYLEGANFSGANLVKANFSGADLWRVNFSGANLRGVDFSEADILGANFSGADLGTANFLGAQLSDDKGFIDCYCEWSNDVDFLPKPPPGYKFEFEERTDENNQPIYPKNNPDYRYIKLIKI